MPVGDGEGWLRLAVGRLDRSAPASIDPAETDREPSRPRSRRQLDPFAIRPDELVRSASPPSGRARLVAKTSQQADAGPADDPAGDVYIARALAVLHDMTAGPGRPATPTRPQESK